MGILTLLRNAFGGRSRKGAATEAEGAETTPSQEAAPKPTPTKAATVPEPRTSTLSTSSEHELVAAAFDKAAAAKPTPSAETPATEDAGPPKTAQIPTQPAPDKAAPETPVAETPVAEKPVPEASTPEEPVAEDVAVQATSAEEPATEQPAAEEPVSVAEEQPPVAEVAPEPEPVVEPEPEAAPEPEVTPTAEAAPEPKPEPAAEVTPEPASDPEPETVVEPEPQPTAEVTPAPEPEPAVTPETPAPAAAAADDETGTGGAGGNIDAVPATLRTAYTAAATALTTHGLTGTAATTYLVLDRSASMRPYYKDGSAQALGEQTLALAAHLDPESKVHVVFFSTELDGTGELTLTEHENKIDDLHAGLGRMGRTSYHAAVEEVLAHHGKNSPDTPALVVFQTDGAPDAKTPATQALTEAAKTHPAVFFSFVAFGDPENKAFDYLRKLKLPNTSHFLAGETPKELTDAEIYEGILANWRP
ncbi:VWA domain-containing protein [Streptomyces sp. NPDC088921]|uniref:VWA domain-containing protein n=1 Tax=unclassified Streptomyces TaxID=2593676 RepID=UPI00341EE6A8